MKKYLLLFTLLIGFSVLFNPPVFAETCYFSMDNTGEINSKVANSISLSLLSRYFKPLSDMPRGGVKEGACVYGGSIGVM